MISVLIHIQQEQISSKLLSNEDKLYLSCSQQEASLDEYSIQYWAANIADSCDTNAGGNIVIYISHNQDWSDPEACLNLLTQVSCYTDEQ